MHIPDGILDGKTLAVAGALAGGGVGVALWQARRLPPSRVPLMGVSAAFVFAAQMLNFPVAGGTSGHLIGGVLAAVLLGPGAAVLVLSAVLIVQCLLFADGGLLALGANILNMAIIDSVGGYMIYAALKRLLPGRRGRIAAVAFAAWAGAVLAAAVCSGELVGSHVAPARVVFPAMLGIHMLIGIGEAAITAIVLLAVWSSRPQLIEPATNQSITHKAGLAGLLAYGLLIALALATFVSPFASKLPDGLDWAAQRMGFADKAAARAAPISNYQTPHVSNLTLATGLAGLIGTVVVFALCLALARILVPGRGADGTDAGVTQP